MPPVLGENVEVLFVGINPGRMSARAGHHFANPANAFWRLLHESGLTPRRLAPEEDRELLAYGLGLTNLVTRWTPGVSDLGPEDWARGRAALLRTVRRVRPAAVVFVGVTGYRAFFGKKTAPVPCGEQPESIAGARVFVVPNPSGRNAHYRYGEMLEHFRACARALGRGAKGKRPDALARPEPPAAGHARRAARALGRGPK